MKKRHLFVFGTRPEAVKMAPLIREFRKCKELEVKVCVTAQHREMLDQILNFFEITPDYDLNLMKPRQDLYSLTSDILLGLRPILESLNPHYVFVHGDTLTSTAAALAAFYARIKVCHIEAGLRTFEKLSPYPEEMNRQITGRIADYHFAPTKKAFDNLIKENISKESIIITGNTVIDSLLESVKKLNLYENDEIKTLKSIVPDGKKIIVVTGHRRENHGEGFVNICGALKIIAERNDDVHIIYPVHLNPNVQEPVLRVLSGIDNVSLIDPLSYPAFVWLMNKAFLIITDSGGVQEEAPSLGKPVLVMRNSTERPEAVDAGTVKLVGTNKELIINETNNLLRNRDEYNRMASINNPYGDGTTSKRILDFVLENL